MDFINETNRDIMVKVGYDLRQTTKVPIWATVKVGKTVNIEEDKFIASAIKRGLSKIILDTSNEDIKEPVKEVIAKEINESIEPVKEIKEVPKLKLRPRGRPKKDKN